MTTKKTLLIIAPFIIGGGFLFWYLKRSKKKAFKAEEDPGKAKENPGKEKSQAAIENSNEFPLKNGTFNSSLVSELQTILNSAGAKLTVDGDFGPKTEAALLVAYGKKQIDSSNDFSAFKAKVQASALYNMNYAKGQLVINNYAMNASTMVYTTQKVTGRVVIPNVNGSFTVTDQTIPFEKFQSFAHSRFVPKAVTNTGDLRAQYTTAEWPGAKTYMIIINAGSLAVK